MADRNGTSSRIAIQLGGPSNNGATRKHTRPPHTSTLGKRHRTGHALNGGDSSDEEAEETSGRHEVITEFGPDGASSSSSSRRHRHRHRSRSPRDSRSDRRDRRDYRDRSNERKGTDPADEEEPVQYGLIINKKPRHSSPNRKSPVADTNSSTTQNDTTKPQSADEEALSALLCNEPRKTLLSHRSADDEDDDREPEREDYAKVPIDDFGAQLLKGFGWDGKMRGEVRQVKHHANLTGLGAKGKGAEELDAWMQKTKQEARGGGGGSDKPRRPRLDEYRREEEKTKARRAERARESERGGDYRRDDRDRERHRDRDRGHDRDRDRDRNRR
jgi:hypothetical protein